MAKKLALAYFLIWFVALFGFIVAAVWGGDPRWSHTAIYWGWLGWIPAAVLAGMPTNRSRRR